MNRFLISAAAAAALMVAGAAQAQTSTGTIAITGSVAGKCAVTSGGSATWGSTIALGELADSSGVLKTSLSGSTAGANLQNFSLSCTGANVGVSVLSTALDNTDVASAPSGYTQTVNLQGRAYFDLVTNPSGSSTLEVTDDSSVAGATTGSFGAANFLANTTNNVRVSAYGFNTAPGALLMAGPYSGSIVVVMTPS